AGEQETLEHALDPIGLTDHPLEPCPATTGTDESEVARPRAAEPLAVDDDRHTWLEERLPDDELAASPDLDDHAISGRHIGSQRSGGVHGPAASRQIWLGRASSSACRRSRSWRPL